MNQFEAAREALIRDLRKYLVGPVGPQDELINEPAYDRYHVGILFPSGTEVPAEEDEQENGAEPSGGESGADDGILALANVARQAAAGFTFQVPVGTALCVRLEYADYLPEFTAPQSVQGAEVALHAASATKQRRIQWKRRPYIKDGIRAEVSGTTGAKGTLLHTQDEIEVISNIRVIGQIASVTLSVVNRRPVPDREKKRKSDELPEDRAIYQVALQVVGLGQDVFVARPSGIHISDPEFVTHELLYRNVRQFAVGHGCAVDWESSPREESKAASIRLEWIPQTEVSKASAVVKELEGASAQDVEFLSSDVTNEQICGALDVVGATYGKWIDTLEAQSERIVAGFESGIRTKIRDAAAANISACRRVQQRISEGVALLRKDRLAFEAFRLGNRAMADSMRRSRPSDKPRWFPFQIAFLLMSLPSALDGAHPDRESMDLIWFPTGGGKTEAYLGLVSIVLFHRRLTGKGSSKSFGTAILTRYTLRLLTVQQFERAARAVMACEVIRRQHDHRMGDVPFSIGLFVGNSATPGKIEVAAKIIAGTADQDETATTLPLTKCPWCGHALSYRNQRATSKAILTLCPNTKCEFHSGIPFACVDEQMFEEPPSMIIGTVDKFAMMAWEPRIGEFFGGPDRSRLPPSLIIQDELHLITDALGTVTALYETAIDYLCSVDGNGPKIVGSTATIRRAPDQARRLYDRAVQQFPPSGLDYNDSFFYSEDLYNPGRTYVGVHAQGRSPKYSLARVMGTLAQRTLEIEPVEVRDHYYTLVAYFNSLRELGGAIVLTYDDVRRYIDAMPDAGNVRRRLDVIQELTSYLPSQEIPNVLALMARGIVRPDPDADSAPIDVVLSTNMISVGVDVDRLGLMVMNGQPKTTSEYIQASSRVGRPKGSAGLVVTLYNWTRPRDRSHYERFRTYHKSFYRYVEATTVTPFSPRARDRALHGVLFALSRMTIPALAGASPAYDETIEAKLKSLCAVIESRALHVEDKEAAFETREQLQTLLEEWKSGVRQTASWKKTGQMGTCYFLAAPAKGNGDAVFDPTPMSMRDVDPPSPVRLMSFKELEDVFGSGDSA